MKTAFLLVLSVLVHCISVSDAATGPGGKIPVIAASDLTEAKSLADLLDPILSQAKDRTVRVLMGGTSIASFGYSGNQMFAFQLKALYGDARSDVLRMGVFGGSFDLPVQGWYKQPYSGPTFVRLRGDSASLPLDWTAYGSEIVIEYSKEADGGTCQVEIDGAPVGIIDCNGSQTLSAQARFTVPAGFHKVTFRPPSSGFAYLERLIFEQERPGIAIIDGTLGGSGLINVYANFPRGEQSVAGIPTEPGKGVASYFQRPDIDAVIWSGPVNDLAGNSVDFATWTQRMDEIVAAMGPQIAPDGVVTLPARPLILIAEMGGHSAMPASPYNAAFLQRYEYLRMLGNEHPHVYTLDWHGATFDPDIPRYAENYYGNGQPVWVDPETGAFTGDFIHPNISAHRIALQLLCSSLGIPTPIETEAGNLENRIRKTSPVLTGTPIDFLEGNLARSERSSELGASVYGGQSYACTLPLVFSEEVTNLTDLNNQIAASSTADRFGKYIYPSDQYHIPIFSQVNAGERVTVTALIKPNSPGTPVELKSPSNGPGVMLYQNSMIPSTNAVLNDRDEPPIWITFDYIRGEHTVIVVTGRLYSISVTRTNGQPVSTVRPIYEPLATVTTLPASAVTSSTATIYGSATPNHDGAISVAFDYGTNPDLTGATGTLNRILSSDDPATAVSQELSGLSPQTVYFFRTGATLAGNPTPVVGEIRSFMTPGVAGYVPLLSIAGGRMKLYGEPGQEYPIEASEDLKQWETILSVALGDHGLAEFVDVDAANLAQRFYRIRYPLP